jgi:diketogulonate reductase-like aldo/keto reductase
MIGLGTWDLRGQELKQAVTWSIEMGYRHFDTATYYENEKELGEILNQSKISRDEKFIVSKLWPRDFGYAPSKRAFAKSLESLKVDYLDLYLIHWPSDRKKTDESWRGLLDIYQEGLSKSIGVSNYSIENLEHLKSLGDIVPMVNQVEFHPFRYDRELLDYCISYDIALVAYSPLVEGKRMTDKGLIEISNNYKKSVAQILLRWGLQNGVTVIPKSSNRDRLRENASIFDFEINTQDMEVLNSL